MRGVQNLKMDYKETECRINLYGGLYLPNFYMRLLESLPQVCVCACVHVCMCVCVCVRARARRTFAPIAGVDHIYVVGGRGG